MSAAASYHVELVEQPFDPRALSYARGIYLLVRGMSCQRCVTRVRNSLLRLAGVYAVEIWLESGLVAVAHAEHVALDDLLNVIARAGAELGHDYQAQALEGFTPADVFLS